MMQEARAQTESFMARVAREPDAVQAVTDHITSLNFGLAHQHDKVKRLERQVRTIETLKLRLADAISGETLCSNFILDSIGEGFNAARTLRRHTAEWRTKILGRYGVDVQKAASVIEHLHSQISPPTSTSASTSEHALASISGWFTTMREAHKGRMPNDVRAAWRAVHMALVLCHEDISDAKMALETGCSRKVLAEERERYFNWVEGSEETLINFRSKVRSDKTPKEWVDYCIEQWCSDDHTRCGEGKADYDIDPFDRTNQMRRRYLDVQIGDVVAAVQSGGEEKFPAGHTYDDGVVRPAFHMGWKMVSALRPFYVKDNTRDTCLCWRCERWKHAAAALYFTRCEIKKTTGCDCPNKRGGYDLLQQFMCNPKTPDCIDSKCEKCKGPRLVFGEGGAICKEEFDMLEAVPAVKWERYEKCPYITKAGDEKTVMDFKRVETPAAELLGEVRDMEAETRAHYQHFKWCAKDKRHVRTNVARGTVHSIQDFSENGNLQPKREIQSRYFREKGYTLYGCVVDRRIEDLKDITEVERARLLQLKQDKGLPPIIQETIIIISDDLVHDNAAVQHFNDKIILPYLKETSNCDLKVHYVTSDGAPCQYKCANHFLWLSKHHARSTVYIDWSVGTPAHNKDMSDAECGGAKHVVDECNMAHVSGDQERQVQLEEVAEVAAHLQRTYTKPKKSLEEKGGRGVYRRHIVHHCSATNKINRRLPAAETVHGTKGFFQFTDIGEEGKLRFRPKPCHQCPGCMELDVGACQNMRECGAPQVLEIPTRSNPELPTTRNGMCQRGIKISQECIVGDFVVVELKGLVSEKFMVARVTRAFATAGTTSTSWYGDVVPADDVLRVVKFDPMLMGGTTFELRSDCDIAIFPEDVRAKLALGGDIKQLPAPVTRATRARPHFPRFSVTSDAHAHILQLISPVEEGTLDRNDPHRLTAFRFFDEEDQIQYIVEGFCCEETSEGGKKGRTFTIRNVDTNELDTMWEDSLLEYLHEAKAKAAVRDIEDSEGEVED